MKDHEIALLVNLITEDARVFAGTQQLRERIAYRLVPVLKRLQQLERENINMGWQLNPDRMGQ